MRNNIFIVVSVSSYFFSHRLALAQFLKNNDYQITIVCYVDKVRHREKILESGFSLLELPEFSEGFDVKKDLKFSRRLRSYIKEHKPALVLAVSLRLVILSMLSCIFNRGVSLLGIVAGLGFLATNNSLKNKILRGAIYIYTCVMTLLFKYHFIVQNQDDYKLFCQLATKKNVALIRGSGVDTMAFKPRNIINVSEHIIVTMVARMLKDKGVYEFINAAKLVQEALGKSIVFQLVGDIHTANPNSITTEDLENIERTSVVRWLGHHNDIAEIYQRSDIAVLPSYREGLPKSLLEAAACGLPLVATDVPGCREVCIDSYNGYLVVVKDPQALAKALIKLIENKDLLREFGKNSRRFVTEKLSIDTINKETLKYIKKIGIE